MKRLLLATGMVVALVATGVGCFVWGKWQSDVRRGPGVYTRLYVARQPPYVLSPHTQDKEEFDRYRNGQAALIRSRLVLNSALQDPKVAALSSVKAQTDPVGWLEKNLIIDFADGSEILRIAMQGDDYQSLTVIVNAVRNAYLKDVVYKEHNLRLNRLAKLKQLHAEYDKRLAERKQALAMFNRDTGGQEINVQIAKDLLKELPQLQLAEVAARERLKHANGKEADELKMQLDILEAQRKMIMNDHEKLVQSNKEKVNLEFMRDEIAREESVAKRLATMIAELEIELQAPERISMLEEAMATDALVVLRVH